MISRRTLIASGAASMALLPQISAAVTEMPISARWPEIQGPGVDTQRTRFISGRGIRNKPSNSQINRPELGFVQNTEVDPSMAMTHGVVMARAMGPNFPLVGMDAASGELAWEHERTLKILGVTDKFAFIVTASDSDENMVILKAVDVTGPTDQWTAEEQEIAGSVVVPKEALIYTRHHEDRVELVARDIASGNVKWAVDVTDDIGSKPGVLSTDGNIVVDVYQTTNVSMVMPAWGADTGELLWRHEGPGFISSPTFHEGNVVVATLFEGVQLLDPTSGEVVRRLELPHYIGGLVKLIVTDDALVIVDSQNMHSIDWNSGAVNWSRPPRQAASSQEIYACDGMILRMENATETSFRETALRGYSLHDGRLLLEYLPMDAELNELNAAAFLVGSQQLFLATDTGLGTWFPSEEALDPPSDPMYDRVFANEELGFSYSWDEDWSALGSTHLTPNGLIFEHASLDQFVSQSAGPVQESDDDFNGNWHAVFGPSDSSILEINPVDAPQLDFIPDAANIFAVVYRTTRPMPADLCFGIRVLIALEDNQRLVFEYLQYGVPFEDKIDSFATFFESLIIDP